MNDGKTYRWLRVLEYVGTLGFINDAVAKRNIKGSKTLTKGVIRESFIGDTPIETEGYRDGLSHDEIIVACRNVGLNLECGGCAAVFYTGYGAPHDENCSADKSTVEEKARVVRIVTDLQQANQRAVNLQDHAYEAAIRADLCREIIDRIETI